MMDFNEFAKELHEQLVAKGIDCERMTGTKIVSGIHARISLALRNYKLGRSMVYHNCTKKESFVVCELVECEHKVNGECAVFYKDDKPQGAVVDLIDVVLGLLEIAAFRGMELHPFQGEKLGKSSAEQQLIGYAERTTMEHLTNVLHFKISEIEMEKLTGRYAQDQIDYMILMIFCWLHGRGLADPFEVLRSKFYWIKGQTKLERG